MGAQNFSHLVEIEEGSRQLKIYRLFGDGRKDLYTSVDLPSKSIDEDEAAYEKFVHDLGEGILLDSPVARRLLNI